MWSTIFVIIFFSRQEFEPGIEQNNGTNLGGKENASLSYLLQCNVFPFACFFYFNFENNLSFLHAAQIKIKAYNCDPSFFTTSEWMGGPRMWPIALRSRERLSFCSELRHLFCGYITSKYFKSF